MSTHTIALSPCRVLPRSIYLLLLRSVSLLFSLLLSLSSIARSLSCLPPFSCSYPYRPKRILYSLFHAYPISLPSHSTLYIQVDKEGLRYCQPGKGCHGVHSYTQRRGNLLAWREKWLQRVHPGFPTLRIPPVLIVLFSRPPLPTMASYAQLTLPLYYVSASLVTCGSTWVLSDMGGESETRTLFFCRVFGSSSQEFGVTHCFRKLLNVNHVRKWVLSFDGILPQPQV